MSSWHLTDGIAPLFFSVMNAYVLSVCLKMSELVIEIDYQHIVECYAGYLRMKSLFLACHTLAISRDPNDEEPRGHVTRFCPGDS